MHTQQFCWSSAVPVTVECPSYMPRTTCICTFTALCLVFHKHLLRVTRYTGAHVAPAALGGVVRAPPGTKRLGARQACPPCSGKAPMATSPGTPPGGPPVPRFAALPAPLQGARADKCWCCAVDCGVWYLVLVPEHSKLRQNHHGGNSSMRSACCSLYPSRCT